MKSRMYDEICEQPEVLATILEEEWGTVVDAARALRGRGFRFAMLAARGTSDNAALYAKYLFEVLLGIPTALASPSTFTLYEGHMDLSDVLVVGISQSGESKDILETVSRTRELGARTLALTNEDGSSLAEAAEIHFSLHAGKEQSVAATKTYTAQLLLLYLLVAALKEEDIGAHMRRLPDQAESVLAEGRWENTARYRYAEHLVVTSRGYNFATAREAALKLMEATYVVAEGFSAADLRHGPIAMIGHDFPVVVVVPPGKARPSVEALVEELGGRGAELVVIAEHSAVVDKGAAGFRMPVSCPEELSPILYALPAQILAHDLAMLKGLNPDAPRGLSKVTETW